MRTYPSYKSSGVEWLSEIPEHWHTVSLKHVVKINPESLGSGTNPNYAIRYVDIGNVNAAGQIVGEEKYRFENAPSRARRIVRDGDVIVSTVRTYLKAITYMDNPPSNRIVSTGFAVLRPTDKVHPEFLGRLTSSPQFVGSVVANSQGVSYPAINTSKLGELPVWLPPFPEQQAIAAYLDRKTAQIDTLIRKRRRLITLLREQRAAVIARAVTKGLDPDAEMNDSGVAWLGAVPKHWEVTKLKFVSRVQSGVTKGRNLKSAQTVSVPYLRVANVQDGYLNLSDVTEIEIKESELGRYRLRPGDVLMTEGGDFDKLGRGAVWSGQIDPCIHQNHVFAVRPSAEVKSRWLNLITLTQYAKRYFIVCSVQSTNLASISQTNLKDLPLPLPPVEEQSRIIQNVDEKTRELERLIEQENSLIAKLQELRTALISEAVTGKIDVREEVPA